MFTRWPRVRIHFFPRGDWMQTMRRSVFSTTVISFFLVLFLLSGCATIPNTSPGNPENAWITGRWVTAQTDNRKNYRSLQLSLVDGERITGSVQTKRYTRKYGWRTSHRPIEWGNVDKRRRKGVGSLFTIIDRRIESYKPTNASAMIATP